MLLVLVACMFMIFKDILLATEVVILVLLVHRDFLLLVWSKLKSLYSKFCVKVELVQSGNLPVADQ
jgi:hypothetical protein